MCPTWSQSTEAFPIFVTIGVERLSDTTVLFQRYFPETTFSQNYPSTEESHPDKKTTNKMILQLQDYLHLKMILQLTKISIHRRVSF